MSLFNLKHRGIYVQFLFANNHNSIRSNTFYCIRSFLYLPILCVRCITISVSKCYVRTMYVQCTYKQERRKDLECLFFAVRSLDLNMVIILYGNSEIDTRVRGNIYYLICLRHLIRSRPVTNRIFFLRKDLFFSMCARHLLVTI